MIKVYYVPNCDFCKQAKRMLFDYNVEYEELNLKDKQHREARAFYRNLGLDTLPIIVDKIGDDEYVLEFNKLEEHLKEHYDDEDI